MRIRQSKNTWLIALGVFVAVFLFAFLTAKFKGGEDVEAADLGKFDPGYIISDYQMGNYNAMSEAEIQAFLTKKNPCNNTNYNYYLQLSSSSAATWHFTNGHFVCLSEERFGDGETIGSGDTAAHIIWQTAQDYRINPQVLIVLLQKETGLITDPIPNNYDYRKATGYGCPDTAACSSKYYGFKNQVRNAAALFRTVLDGGWTNYPLGSNYIQYNPNSGCGGSWVNIRSLATSALYRYTPYQPNAAALAAGYGTGDSCSAYGNRNFYSYFEDWFGGVKGEMKTLRIADGEYYVALYKNENKVVDIEANSSINGANIQLYDSNKTEAQEWNFTYNQKTDDYLVVNSKNGKALDVEAAGIENGTNVQLWESNLTCAQRWKIVEVKDKGVSLASSCSNKVLEVDGTMNIQIGEYSYGERQIWELIPRDISFEDGVYTIDSSMSVLGSIDIAGRVQNIKAGSNVQLWDDTKVGTQHWLITKKTDGYYEIKNLQSKKFLDVAAASTLDGANVQVWDANNTCAQKWQILKNSDGSYSFVSGCSYKVIDLSAANTQNGTNIQIFTPNKTKAQRWRINKVASVEDGEYNIVSDLSNEKVLDLSGNIGANGTNIQLYDSNGTSAQEWEIKYVSIGDFYTIRNVTHNKFLDVAAASRVAGANVQLWEGNNTCAQKWYFDEIGDGEYVILSACSGLAIDVYAGKIGNGVNIQLWDFNYTKAQKWKFRKISGATL